MNIKFSSDDSLPLNKTIEIPIVTIVVTAVFHENDKYNPQFFLDECLCKKWKWYAMTELTLLKELMLIEQVHQKSVMFVVIGPFFNYNFKFQPNVCYRCHDLLMIYVNVSDISIKNVLIRSFLAKKDLNTLHATTILKIIRHLYILLPKKSAYRK